MTEDNFNFSQSLQRLEEIVAKLEDQDLDLDEGLKLLEEGVQLHKQCTQKLQGAQAKIKEILKVAPLADPAPDSPSDTAPETITPPL